MSGVAIQRILQNSKKWWLWEELLDENDLEIVLANFCHYDYGANTFWSSRSLQIKKIIANAPCVL